jgi:UDP-3-O-[3-hydroxymyristoyl] glucosamine N-acyltransferase
MQHPGFFQRSAPISLAALTEQTESRLGDRADPDRLIEDVKPLAEAGPAHITFLDNRKYLPLLSATHAGACLITPELAPRVLPPVGVLLTPAPYRAFALALTYFYPDALQPKAALGDAGDPLIHPTAVLEADVTVEPGAVVGREAQIGRGTTIAAGALVGYRVTVGRGCYIGPGATLTHALLGDGVILHAGVRVGQDGFGFAMGAGGHLKVPQIGRVIIQNNVEIGANSCVDRGALKDTVIGEGTKIDNLVQIGHNVILGRHCIIVGQVGLSGSTELGDFVVMGGQSGAVGHIKIGAGAQIAGGSHVKDDVPPGARMGGTPAVPFPEWGRQLAAVRRLGRKGSEGRGG